MIAKKIIVGEKYYFGKTKKHFICIEVGIETSFFVDYKKINTNFIMKICILINTTPNFYYLYWLVGITF